MRNILIYQRGFYYLFEVSEGEFEQLSECREWNIKNNEKEWGEGKEVGYKNIVKNNRLISDLLHGNRKRITICHVFENIY